MDADHRPVLLEETLRYWHGKDGGFYIDATLGSGGHSAALLERDPHARCLGIDRDVQALRLAREKLKRYGERMEYFNGNYDELDRILSRGKIPPVSGILADLGVSSMQLDSPDRGFSFRSSGPLDMRMGPAGSTALDLIEKCSEGELAEIIRKWGEEPRARKIAMALKRAVIAGRIQSAQSCASVIAEALGPAAKSKKIHPATKTFQALRMAVNREQDHLIHLLSLLPSILSEGGRVVFISFQSLEDRLVKQAFKSWSTACVCPPSFPKCVCGKKPEFNILTPKAVVPGQPEVDSNPRARSAKLRAAQKI